MAAPKKPRLNIQAIQDQINEIRQQYADLAAGAGQAWRPAGNAAVAAAGGMEPQSMQPTAPAGRTQGRPRQPTVTIKMPLQPGQDPFAALPGGTPQIFYDRATTSPVSPPQSGSPQDQYLAERLAGIQGAPYGPGARGGGEPYRPYVPMGDRRPGPLGARPEQSQLGGTDIIQTIVDALSGLGRGTQNPYLGDRIAGITGAPYGPGARGGAEPYRPYTPMSQRYINAPPPQEGIPFAPPIPLGPRPGQSQLGGRPQSVFGGGAQLPFGAAMSVPPFGGRGQTQLGGSQPLPYGNQPQAPFGAGRQPPTSPRGSTYKPAGAAFGPTARGGVIPQQLPPGPEVNPLAFGGGGGTELGGGIGVAGQPFVAPPLTSYKPTGAAFGPTARGGVAPAPATFAPGPGYDALATATALLAALTGQRQQPMFSQAGPLGGSVGTGGLPPGPIARGTIGMSPQAQLLALMEAQRDKNAAPQPAQMYQTNAPESSMLPSAIFDAGRNLIERIQGRSLYENNVPLPIRAKIAENAYIQGQQAQEPLEAGEAGANTGQAKPSIKDFITSILDATGLDLNDPKLQGLIALLAPIVLGSAAPAALATAPITAGQGAAQLGEELARMLGLGGQESPADTYGQTWQDQLEARHGGLPVTTSEAPASVPWGQWLGWQGNEIASRVNEALAGLGVGGNATWEEWGEAQAEGTVRQLERWGLSSDEIDAMYKWTQQHDPLQAAKYVNPGLFALLPGNVGDTIRTGQERSKWLIRFITDPKFRTDELARNKNAIPGIVGEAASLADKLSGLLGGDPSMYSGLLPPDWRKSKTAPTSPLAVSQGLRYVPPQTIGPESFPPTDFREVYSGIRGSGVNVPFTPPVVPASGTPSAPVVAPPAGTVRDVVTEEKAADTTTEAAGTSAAVTTGGATYLGDTQALTPQSFGQQPGPVSRYVSWNAEEMAAVTQATVGQAMSPQEFDAWVDAFQTQHGGQLPFQVGPFDANNNLLDHLIALGESRAAAASGAPGSAQFQTGNRYQDPGLAPNFWENAYYDRYRAPTFAPGFAGNSEKDIWQDLYPGQMPNQFAPYAMYLRQLGIPSWYDLLRRPYYPYNQLRDMAPEEWSIWNQTPVAGGTAVSPYYGPLTGGGQTW